MPRRRLLSTTEWTWEWEPHSSSPLCRLYRDMIASMFAKEIGRQRKQIQSHLARLSSSSFILQCFDRRDSKLCRELPVPVRSVLFARSFPMECVSIHINSNALGFLHRFAPWIRCRETQHPFVLLEKLGKKRKYPGTATHVRGRVGYEHKLRVVLFTSRSRNESGKTLFNSSLTTSRV